MTEAVKDDGIESTYEIPVLGEPPKTVAPAAPKVPAVSVPDAQNTGAEATPADPKAKPEAAPTPEQVAKRTQNRLDRKLDKAFKERAEAQAQAVFLNQQLAAERAKNAPQIPEGRPTLAQFDYDPEKYAEAVASYATTQAGKDFETRQRSEAGQRFNERLSAGWDEQVEKAEEKFDDWHERVGALKLNPNHIADVAMMKAPNGADVLYHLTQNPKEALRLSQLDPVSQVFEIGQLSAKLTAEPVKPKLPSSAPQPFKPVGGSSSPSTKKLVDIENQDEFEKRRRAQIAARR